jgi:hypothetical protein
MFSTYNGPYKQYSAGLASSIVPQDGHYPSMEYTPLNLKFFRFLKLRYESARIILCGESMRACICAV